MTATTQSAVAPYEPTETDRRHLFDVSTVGAMAGAALITGAFSGLAVLIMVYLIGWPKPWAWGMAVFAIVLISAWIMFLLRWFGLTAPIERVTVLDHDNNPATPPVVRVQLTSEDRRVTQYADLPSTPEKLATFARAALAGRPISDREWSGVGRPFSQNEFAQLRETMIARGWLRWKNPDYPTQGVEISAAGRAVMRQLQQAATQRPVKDP